MEVGDEVSLTDQKTFTRLTCRAPRLVDAVQLRHQTNREQDAAARPERVGGRAAGAR